MEENGASRTFGWHSRVGESEERATLRKCGVTRKNPKSLPERAKDDHRPEGWRGVCEGGGCLRTVVLGEGEIQGREGMRM